MGEITQLIKQIAQKNQPIQTFPARVSKINREDTSVFNPEDSYTIEVIDMNGATYNNVRLKSSIQDKEQGIISIPKLNSWVLVSIIGDVETRAFVTQQAEPERLFGRIQSQNEETLFLEYSIDGEHINVRYLKKEGEIGAEVISEISSLEFDKDQNLKVSYFDENQKIVSQSHFHPDHSSIVFNSVEDDTEQERFSSILSKENATLKFTNDQGNEKNSIQSTPSETIFSLKDDDGVEQQKTTLTEESATITMTDGSNAVIEKEKIVFNTLDNNDQVILDQNNGVSVLSMRKIEIKGVGVEIDGGAQDVVIKGANVNIN